MYLDAEQLCNKHSLKADENDQSEASISASHGAQQLSCGGHMAQERHDKINYQYLMMAIPQLEEKKRFSLGQRSNSGLTTEQDSFLQDSWSTEKAVHSTALQRQMSSVTIEPGDLATDSKSLQRGASHDYQNVSFNGDEETDSHSLRFSRSSDPTSQSPDFKLQSTDPFLCDSWAAQGDSTTTSNPSEVVPMLTANDKSAIQSDYENVWNEEDDVDNEQDSNVTPLQIDFGDLIDAIDNKQQQQHRQQSAASRQHSNTQHDSSKIVNDDYHDYHKGPIKVQSQPIQRSSNSIVLSSGSHADPVSGDPDYENYGSGEDYANVFDTPSTQANQKSASGYDMLELKSPPPKSNTLSGQSFSITGSHDQTNEAHDTGSHETRSHKLVESNGNPFAGLVITASPMSNNQSCHDDLTRSMARSVIRRSNASYLDNSDRQSYWSSDRVEEEFDQVTVDDVTNNHHNFVD